MNFFKLLLFILLVLTAHLSAENESLEKVTLQLQWKHQFEFSGFYAAKEKGFYKAVGLDVSFLEYDGQSTVDKVVKGRVDYGLDYSSIIAEYSKGKPIVFIANFFKQSPLVIIAQENIKTPSDLKGKKVMGVSDTIDNITLLNMLNKFNVGIKDIENVPTTFNVNDFISKKVDAMTAFSTNELYSLDKKGIKYNVFDPTVFGAEYYDLNLFTSKKKVEINPEEVKKFKEASIKGWKYALAHKEEVADLIMRKYNSQQRSKEALLYEAKQIENLMLSNVYPIGSIDRNRVKLIAENFKQGQFIDSNHLQLDNFIFKYHYHDTQDTAKYNSLYLSDQEKNYLERKKEIKMCVDPNWMPYETIENAQHVGIAADYMNHISSILNTPVTLVSTQTWSESLALFQNEQCDILSLVATTPNRMALMNFTNPYLTSPLVLATQDDKPFISDISELKEKRIGILRNYASAELLENKYLNIHFVKVNTTTIGLKMVEKGELYGFIDSLTPISYQIQKHFPTQLKIAGQLNEKLEMGIATHKNKPLLLAILNKSINSIKDETKQNILQRWGSYKFHHTDSGIKTVWKIFSPILLLAILLIISHYVLRQYNKKLKKQVEHNIEELRQKDEVLLQKQRMAAMGEMLSMIAHQWRQPLGAINFALMGIEVKLASGHFNLETKDGREKFLSYLEKKHQSINEYVQHLSTTTDDFRNFFNPNKSKELVPLTTPIENALSIVQMHMEKHGIEIVKDYQTETELRLYGNEVMQVILTLLKNAEDNFLINNIRDPKITIKTQKVNNNLMISIGDNGGGIPKDVVDKIFQPYYSTKNEKHGTGLGLYMSRIIIEEHHNGNLDMENKDAGVSFKIIFKT